MENKDLIDRKALIDWFMPYIHSGIEKIPVETVIDDIKTIPAADVALVNRGEWNITRGQIENAVCSCCGRRFQSYYSDYQYCPRCGAKMHED